MQIAKRCGINSCHLVTLFSRLFRQWSFVTKFAKRTRTWCSKLQCLPSFLWTETSKTIFWFYRNTQKSSKKTGRALPVRRFFAKFSRNSAWIHIYWQCIAFICVYVRNVDDVDLYIAGISETSVPGGLLGPTFACLAGYQFRDLKKWDRLWHENGGAFTVFTPGNYNWICFIWNVNI